MLRHTSRIILVRHGKASVLSADYDNLSDTGAEQSRLLGEHWADEGLVIDSIFVGPRRRHRQTLDAVATVFRARGLSWPEATELRDLDEHDGLSIVMQAIPKLAQSDAELRSVAEAMAKGETPPLAGLLTTFKRVTRMWVRGELSSDGVESWTAFRARVNRALQAMASAATSLGPGKTVAAFTSAGAIAAAVGHVLDVGDEKVLELSWSLNNGSLSELTISRERNNLHTFNATPHLRDPKLVTSV